MHVYSRSARDVLRASTLEAIERRAAAYHTAFRKSLKVEKSAVEDIHFDANIQQGGFAERAKIASYRFYRLPNISQVPDLLEGSLLDYASFGDLSVDHQQSLCELVSKLSAGSEPVMLAFKQRMRDEEVYASLLSGDKAELSWRHCLPWVGITQIVVILRSDEDIHEAQAKPSAPSTMTLPVSLSLDAKWLSNTGSDTHTTALQLSMLVELGQATQVRSAKTLCETDVLTIHRVAAGLMDHT